MENQHEQEHDVYGGDLPEEDYMEAEFDGTEAEVEAEADADAEAKAKELETMKKRLQEIEEEAGALREMQAKVEKEMGGAQDDSAGASATQAEKEEVDSRSISVGSVSS